MLAQYERRLVQKWQVLYRRGKCCTEVASVLQKCQVLYRSCKCCTELASVVQKGQVLYSRGKCCTEGAIIVEKKKNYEKAFCVTQPQIRIDVVRLTHHEPLY